MLYTVFLGLLLVLAWTPQKAIGFSKSPLNYHVQTDEGDERFFKYQTLNGQFRKEKRLDDGTQVGTYGWIDPTGLLRLYDYVADDWGYRIVNSYTENVNKGTAPYSSPGQYAPNTVYASNEVSMDPKHIQTHKTHGKKMYKEMPLPGYAPPPAHHKPAVYTSKEHFGSYEVPHSSGSQESVKHSYSAPHPVVSNSYGPPKQSYSVPEKASNSYEVPSNSYTVPSASSTYKSKETYAVPEAPKHSYKVPDPPQTSYGIPGIPKDTYKAPTPEKSSHQVPQNSYIAPVIPKKTYATPEVPQNSYKVPNVPKQPYIVPETSKSSHANLQVPEQTYGVPVVQQDSYSAPVASQQEAYQVPQPSYTLPVVPNKETYVVPKETYKAPEPSYEVPVVQKQTYVAPKNTYKVPEKFYAVPVVPKQTYVAPKDTYKVPEKSYAVPVVPKQTYVAPKETYKVPEKSYVVPVVPKQTYVAPKETYKVPEQSYAVPAVVPKQTYAAPKETYKVPEPSYAVPVLVSKESYQLPAAPKETYHVPTTLKATQEVPAIPKQTYGVPEPHKASHFVPEAVKHSYSVPEPPKQSYAVPTTPAKNSYKSPEEDDHHHKSYKNPEKIHQGSYQPPKAHHHSTTYVAPKPTYHASNSYDVPKKAVVYSSPRRVVYKKPVYQQHVSYSTPKVVAVYKEPQTTYVAPKVYEKTHEPKAQYSAPKVTVYKPKVNSYPRPTHTYKGHHNSYHDDDHHHNPAATQYIPKTVPVVSFVKTPGDYHSTRKVIGFEDPDAASRHKVYYKAPIKASYSHRTVDTHSVNVAGPKVESYSHSKGHQHHVHHPKGHHHHDTHVKSHDHGHHHHDTHVKSHDHGHNSKGHDHHSTGHHSKGHHDHHSTGHHGGQTKGHHHHDDQLGGHSHHHTVSTSYAPPHHQHSHGHQKAGFFAPKGENQHNHHKAKAGFFAPQTHHDDHHHEKGGHFSPAARAYKAANPTTPAFNAVTSTPAHFSRGSSQATFLTPVKPDASHHHHHQPKNVEIPVTSYRPTESPTTRGFGFPSIKSKGEDHHHIGQHGSTALNIVVTTEKHSFPAEKNDDVFFKPLVSSSQGDVSKSSGSHIQELTSVLEPPAEHGKADYFEKFLGKPTDQQESFDDSPLQDDKFKHFIPASFGLRRRKRNIPESSLTSTPDHSFSPLPKRSQMAFHSESSNNFGSKRRVVGSHVRVRRPRGSRDKNVQVGVYDHGSDGDFRYNTGNQFHYEKILPNGDKQGRFGYVDPLGVFRQIHYTASSTSGFHVQKDFRQVGEHYDTSHE